MPLVRYVFIFSITLALSYFSVCFADLYLSIFFTLIVRTTAVFNQTTQDSASEIIIEKQTEKQMLTKSVRMLYLYQRIVSVIHFFN